MKKIVIIAVLAFQFSFAQNTLPVGSLQITNDGMFNTNINSGNVSRIDMGFDGSKGFINFGAHTGDGYRNNIFYMRGSDGHIGLGTSTPRAVLDVSYHIGNGVLGAVFGRLSEGDNNGDGTFLGVRGYNTSVVNGKSFSIEHSFYGITNSSINFFRGGSTTGGGISFNTNANEEQMRINANGNVGIGEINPQNKLDVNGTIHSKEVKVDMNGWSDFVFKKEYSLATLEQVEKHIAEKGHLENIPNEEEVLKNGISLGEMNAKLLQKIEELTLYMIEQNKRTNKIEQENQDLRKEIATIKKTILN